MLKAPLKARDYSAAIFMASSDHSTSLSTKNRSMALSRRGMRMPRSVD